MQMLTKQFREVESLFLKLIHEYVYGETSKLYCVLENVDIAIEDELITYKFRYGVEGEGQNNPEFFMNLKYYNNLHYLRGRFEQYLQEHHLDETLWDYIVPKDKK